MHASAERRSPRPSRDRVLLDGLLVGLVAVAAQLWILGRVDGWRLADSVEYLDRAWEWTSGEGLGPENTRSFAFSLLFTAAQP